MDDINAQSFALEARQGSSAGRAADYGSGTETARGLLNSGDNGFTAGLGGENQAMSQAIKAKYGGTFNRAQDRLNVDNLKNAKADHLKKLEVATQMATQEHQMNFEKEMQRKKMAQMAKAMRGQVVGSVLGIVGAGAGAFFGGPAGMMAGAALGQGAGQAIGSG